MAKVVVKEGCIMPDDRGLVMIGAGDFERKSGGCATKMVEFKDGMTNHSNIDDAIKNAKEKVNKDPVHYCAIVFPNEGLGLMAATYRVMIEMLDSDEPGGDEWAWGIQVSVSAWGTQTPVKKTIVADPHKFEGMESLKDFTKGGFRKWLKDTKSEIKDAAKEEMLKSCNTAGESIIAALKK